jgi:hypothetical protein
MLLSATGLLIGILNIGIVVVLLLFLGILIEWLCGQFELALPAQARKLYLILVLLIALIMAVSLAAGMPLRVV